MVWRGPVAERAEDIGGLLWDPDGLLVGTTSSGELFTFDTDRREVVDRVPLPLGPDGRRLDRWGSAARTVYDPACDSYLATRAGHLVQVDRTTRQVTVLSRNLERITRAGNGRLFALDETNLYLVDPVPYGTVAP